MNYRVTHTTTYEYTAAVSLCQNLAHLTPRETPEQRCSDTNLAITPEPSVLTPLTDYFGNPATFFAVQEPHRKLQITATHAIEIAPRPVPDPAQTPPWEDVRDLLHFQREPETLQAYQFVFASRYAKAGADLANYALSSFVARRPLLDALLDLTARIHTDFHYDPRATTVATPLRGGCSPIGRGVCQDFAHLQIACLRSLGLAARYVSGYLSTKPPPGQPRLIGTDATHAWIAVYCPGLGWIELDATNNVIPSDKHVLLAWGRDYDDVSPVKGVVLGGGRHRVHVGVDVSPVSPEEV